jgi:hypothetical protein
MADDLVSIPRSHALKIARYERDSLKARTKSSRECSRQWNAAAAQADLVVQHLARRNDRSAAIEAMRVGPAWKKAADCEGWPTTPAPIGNPSRPGEVNHGMFDRYALAHGAVGVGLGVARAKWWQALAFTVAWELVESPLKRRFPRAFPYSSEDTMRNAIGDSIAVMAGWGLWKLLEKAAER